MSHDQPHTNHQTKPQQPAAAGEQPAPAPTGRRVLQLTGKGARPAGLADGARKNTRDDTRKGTVKGAGKSTGKGTRKDAFGADGRQAGQRAGATRQSDRSPGKRHAAQDAGRAGGASRDTSRNTSPSRDHAAKAPRSTPRSNVWRSSPSAAASQSPKAAQTAVPEVAVSKGKGAVSVVAATADAAQAAAGAELAGIRLNKRMADLGLCSRREADDWIARGWVFVNGEPAQMGQRVQAQDSIHVDKAAYVQQEQLVTFLLHKPVGYVSGQPEDGYPSAATLLGSGSRWPGDKTSMRFLPRQLRGLAPAGRLDIDSTGLLVLTQDGRIARQLIGADSTTDKEYLVRVEYATPQGVVRERVQAAFPPEKLALLRHGLSLDGQALQPAQVDWQNPEQLRFVLTEGKKRQIRRMCEAVGLHVVGLKRVRIGRIMLGDLPSGQWRFLRADERF